MRERLELGAITPAVSYIQGQQVRRRIIDEFLAAMEPVDLLVTPTGPTAATLLEGDLITGDEADPQVLAALIHFSGPFNLTGFPAVSIPCGFTPGGLPVGMQLIGKPWQEGPLLAAAHAYEQATDWHRRLPAVLQRRDHRRSRQGESDVGTGKAVGDGPTTVATSIDMATKTRQDAHEFSGHEAAIGRLTDEPSAD